MALSNTPTRFAIGCWPSRMAVAVARAWRIEPPRVLIIQTEGRDPRRIEHFTLRFDEALAHARSQVRR